VWAALARERNSGEASAVSDQILDALFKTEHYARSQFDPELLVKTRHAMYTYACEKAGIPVERRSGRDALQAVVLKSPK